MKNRREERGRRDRDNNERVPPRSFKQVVWLSFSEADERFLDLFRVGYALGLVCFLVFSGYSIFFQDVNFTPMEWAGGFATLLFGSGVAVGARGRLEDGPTNHLAGGHDDGYNPYDRMGPADPDNPERQETPPN